MINKEVDLNVGSTEKEALKSIIYDLLDIVEYFGRTNGFNDWVINDRYDPDNNELINFEEWFDKIRLKMRKSEFVISRENTSKIERLFMETMAFVDCSITRKAYRWESICKGFSLQRNIDEIAEDNMINMEYLLDEDEYFNEDMRIYLKSELKDFIDNADLYYDPPLVIIGYKIGAWFMEVVRNDFPELFVD